MKTVLARIAEAVLTLWLLATLCFFLLRSAPGGPFDTEKAAPPEVQAALAATEKALTGHVPEGFTTPAQMLGSEPLMNLPGVKLHRLK